MYNYSEVFDEAGFAVEREESEEEGEEDKVSLRFGTNCSVDLEKVWLV